MRMIPFLKKTLAALAVLVSTAACSQSDFGKPDQSQQFAAGVTYNSKVDLLLMIDNSSSMVQYQNKFANEVPGMINALNALGIDYHIAVTTTDMRSAGTGGKFQGSPKFLTSTSPDLINSLQARVRQGQSGSDLERGLDSLRASLQPAYLSGDGAGFLRDDALLAMVVLSNEDDYGVDSPATYRDFFDRLRPPIKGTTKGWLMNFLGILSIDGTCRTTEGLKEAGLRYMALADDSNGIKQSVCDATLTTAVSNVRARIVDILSAYQLDRVPILDSIRVTINGALVPQDPDNGWTFEAADNSVHFHGSFLPGAQDGIHVDYSPAEGL